MPSFRPTILVIDDDHVHTALVERMLRPLEVEVVTASSGEEGFRLAAARPPDAVILDLVMPDMGGRDLCKAFRHTAALSDTPVLFLTASEDPDEQADAVELGCVGLLLKPVKPALLRAAVKSALRLKRTLDANQALLEQRRTVANMIVHDMRNLIQANQGFASLALLQNLPPEAQKSLHLVEQTANELSLLANGLLDVEKFADPHLHVEAVPVDLAALARERAEIAGRNVRGVPVRVAAPPEGASPRVLADPALLSRLLDNLNFNAVKFCAKGGEVVVSFSRTDAGWRTRVANDGPPIPAEFHGKIFEKFFQVPKGGGAREVKRGVGLGLTFCRMAAEAMGGGIAVESPLPGRADGTGFVFLLPASA